MIDTRPLLYDLYSCQGGCTRGYQMAGFRVIGVDIVQSKNYIGDGFVRMDCLEFLDRYNAGEFERASAFHASPPCQAFCALRHLSANKHPDLIEPTRSRLNQTGLPWVMENVPGAPLISPVVLCGSMFKLATPCGAELRRHRLFETNWLLMCGLTCDHGWSARVISIHGDKARDRRRPEVISVTGDSLDSEAARKARGGRRPVITVTGHSPVENDKSKPFATISVVGATPLDLAPEKSRQRTKTMSITGHTAQQNVERNEVRETFSVESARAAMGIDWMGMKGLSQAIPPPYCEYVGLQLRNVL